MKKVLGAILSISLVSVLAGAGTFAHLSDEERSTGNTFEAGTMDLYMTDNGPVIDKEWTLNNMIPGKSFKPGELNLYNKGTVDADHVEISFATVCNDPVNEPSDSLIGADGMDKYLKVDSMTYSDYAGEVTYLVVNGASSIITDKNGNGFIDLWDLNGITLDNLKAPKPNSGPCDFDMQISFDKSAPNDYQGDECTLTLTFTLNQDASQ